ncbi:hypothetical protein OROHE_018262 [Orobanche hederae]
MAKRKVNAESMECSPKLSHTEGLESKGDHEESCT